jgi:hypothetical protein
MVIREYIRSNGVLPRRDLLRHLDVLGDGLLALLDWALHVDVLDLLAEIGFRGEQLDEPVLDLDQHVGFFVDVFEEGADGGDAEDLAAAGGLAGLFGIGNAMVVILKGFMSGGGGMSEVGCTYACGGLGSRSTYSTTSKSSW